MQLTRFTSRLPGLMNSIISTLLCIVFLMPPSAAADNLWSIGLSSQTLNDLPGVTSFDAGTSGGGGGSHNLAITNDGTVWSWGYNSQGELGVGDYNNAPGTSSNFYQTVNKLDSTTTFTSAPNPANSGDPVTFTVTVSGPAGKPTPTGSVSFSSGLFGSFNLTNGQVQFNNAALPVGTTSITASYNGDTQYNSSNSAALDQQVNSTAPTPGITHVSLSGNGPWTDSGIDFKIGEFVSIIAGGAINFYYPQYGSSYPYGPDGAGYTDSSASIDPDLPFQSLVGSSGDPLLLSPPAFFEIGSSYYFRAVADGRLWLGVNAAEFASNSGFWDVTITVTPASVVFEPVAITTTSPLPGAAAGVNYGSRILQTTGGSGDFTWSWWNTYDPQYGSTPIGLSLDPASGTITGTPNKPGTYYFTVKVHDNVYGMDVKKDFSLKVNAAVRMTTLWLPDGVNGTSYSETLNAGYGKPPYTWEITVGNLPHGLLLAGSTISGMPDISAAFTFTVKVTDDLGATDSRALTINILDPALKIATTALLPGVVGQDYAQVLESLHDNGAPQWTLVTGSLPPGLGLDSGGIIGGRPRSAGRYTFTIQLTGGSGTVTQAFSILVNAPGEIRAWGYGSNGQLGTGDKTDHNTPVQVSSSTALTAAISVDAGSIHSLAIDAAGLVWSWGQGGNGQLAQATGWENPFPGKVVKSAGGNLGDIVAISAGNLQGGMAVDKAGRLWVWGDNQQGQLGNGIPSFSRNSADVVPGLNDVVAVSSSKSAYHSLAVKADGSVWGWGWNNNGQVGNGDYTPDGSDIHTSIPTRVQGLTDVVAVATGAVHSLALDKFGRVWAWGGNYSGQLGLGSIDSSGSAHLLPSRIPALVNIAAISAGPSYSLALDTQGHLWAWGYNYNGELGLGYKSTSSPYGVTSPVEVVGLDGAGYLSNIQHVSAGSSFVIASDSDGIAWTWGNGTHGQLGDGNSGAGHDTASPRSLNSLNGISAVAGGNMHALALKAIPVNTAPVVSGIPDVTLNQGEYTEFNLDQYVTDGDTSLKDLTWTKSGEVHIGVYITTTSGGGSWIAYGALIDASNTKNWTGIERITFIATDPEGHSGSQTISVTVTAVKGDINGDGSADLTDAILALKSVSSNQVNGVRADYAASGADVNGDNKAGIAEAIYILQKVAGIR